VGPTTIASTGKSFREHMFMRSIVNGLHGTHCPPTAASQWRRSTISPEEPSSIHHPTPSTALDIRAKEVAPPWEGTTLNLTSNKRFRKRNVGNVLTLLKGGMPRQCIGKSGVPRWRHRQVWTWQFSPSTEGSKMKAVRGSRH
jgi:hypothetical protein